MEWTLSILGILFQNVEKYHRRGYDMMVNGDDDFYNAKLIPKLR